MAKYACTSPKLIVEREAPLGFGFKGIAFETAANADE